MVTPKLVAARPATYLDWRANCCLVSLSIVCPVSDRVVQVAGAQVRIIHFAQRRITLLAARFRQRAARVEGDPSTNPIPHIAPEILAGEIALRTGDPETAVTHFRAAADIEDTLLYDEPPLWYYPTRHSLGRALLEAGSPAEAEQAYREDLDRFPGNGWSLFGLTQSLEAQGRLDEAREVESRFTKAWADADVSLTASRF
jgi:tetratricopeptide (TPR) repeat protein